MYIKKIAFVLTNLYKLVPSVVRENLLVSVLLATKILSQRNYQKIIRA